MPFPLENLTFFMGGPWFSLHSNICDNNWLTNRSVIFRQHANSIYVFVRYVTLHDDSIKEAPATFDGRWPSVEDNLWWKTTIGGRQPLLEDDLRWKTTFVGRRPLVEDDLRWKTTFSGRRLLVEDDTFMLPTTLCGIFVFIPTCFVFDFISLTCWRACTLYICIHAFEIND